MTIITDAKRMSRLSTSVLWRNYIGAMDEMIASAKRGDDTRAKFFAAVVRVTLEHYFNAVERAIGR